MQDKSSGKFDIVHLGIPGVLLIRPKMLFRDSRGIFTEMYRFGDIAIEADTVIKPVQASMSHSVPFTMRGLHYQLNNPQGKLVTAITGKIFDVAVDLRRESPTFGRWCGAVLDASEPSSIYIPPQFAHGFMAFEAGATVFYLCTTEYDQESDRTIKYDDPTIDIQWPIGNGANLFMSNKDRTAPRFLDAECFP